jgi:hypothetical protein
LTLRKGDLAGYRALCSEMVRRFEQEGTTAKAPWEAATITRLCTAAPGAVDDPKRPLELGRRAASADDQEPYFLLSRRAAEFRAGQHQAAIGTLSGSVGRFDDAPGRAQAHLFLAMAHHRLGHADAARRALAEADRALAEVPREPDPSTLVRGWHWDGQILAQILRREAGVELGLAAPPGKREANLLGIKEPDSERTSRPTPKTGTRTK